MQPIELVDRYVASVRAQDIDGFIALYAEDAVFVRPDGQQVSGIAAICAMEQRVFDTSPPQPTPIAVVAGERSAAVELSVLLPDGRSLRMANFFHLNAEGRIQRQCVYSQGG